MRLLILLISIATFLNVQKSELDPRLIGRWMMLYTKDASGLVVKDEFFGKKYLETYTKDGRLLLNPQFFRDDIKKQGINAPLDYAAIPALGWKTYNNETLEIETAQGNQQVRFGFSGDTLLLGYASGNTRYLLKRK